MARSIDLHKLSMRSTNEEVISDKTTGLLGLNETVIWRAKHFGIYQNLTSKITEMDPPHSFTDEMVKGAFKSFKHIHVFEELNTESTLMKDLFEFEAPLGILGITANKLFLKKYMKRLLIRRNKVLKKYCEMNS